MSLLRLLGPQIVKVAIGVGSAGGAPRGTGDAAIGTDRRSTRAASSELASMPACAGGGGAGSAPTLAVSPPLVAGLGVALVLALLPTTCRGRAGPELAGFADDAGVAPPLESGLAGFGVGLDRLPVAMPP